MYHLLQLTEYEYNMLVIIIYYIRQLRVEFNEKSLLRLQKRFRLAQKNAFAYLFTWLLFRPTRANVTNNLGKELI